MHILLAESGRLHLAYLKRQVFDTLRGASDVSWLARSLEGNLQQRLLDREVNLSLSTLSY